MYLFVFILVQVKEQTSFDSISYRTSLRSKRLCGPGRFYKHEDRIDYSEIANDGDSIQIYTDAEEDILLRS